MWPAQKGEEHGLASEQERKRGEDGDPAYVVVEEAWFHGADGSEGWWQMQPVFEGSAPFDYFRAVGDDVFFDEGEVDGHEFLEKPPDDVSC